MHDLVDLTGSADKVKQHFRGIDAVEGTGSIAKRDGTKLPNPHAMMLSSDTRARFEAARKAFEKEHPGYTIPVSSVGFGMRDLHQQQTGLGYLGHALGLSFDLHAAENPNLKGPGDEGFGVNSYMLGKFGRDRSKGSAPSRTTISADEKAVEAMGRRTAGAPATPDQQRADAAMQRSLKGQFSPGSSFGDTMHFDFIQGYTDLIPGGRAAVNMRKDRASPENRLPYTPGEGASPVSPSSNAKPPFAGPHPLAPPAPRIPMLNEPS